MLERIMKNSSELNNMVEIVHPNILYSIEPIESFAPLAQFDDQFVVRKLCIAPSAGRGTAARPWGPGTEYYAMYGELEQCRPRAADYHQATAAHWHIISQCAYATGR
jgi:hypothetical protein